MATVQCIIQISSLARYGCGAVVEQEVRGLAEAAAAEVGGVGGVGPVGSAVMAAVGLAPKREHRRLDSRGQAPFFARRWVL